MSARRSRRSARISASPTSGPARSRATCCESCARLWSAPGSSAVSTDVFQGASGGVISHRVSDYRTFRPHPWHGLEPGPRFPDLLTAYVEIVPTDGVKYEIDKESGYLKIDRPQRFSTFCPTLYGFVPRTYCGPLVAEVRIEGGPTVDRG